VKKNPNQLGLGLPTPARPATEPLRFAIPVHAVLRTCDSCDAGIFWIITDRGRKMPVDPDGISHFATCPHAARHRRASSTRSGGDR